MSDRDTGHEELRELTSAWWLMMLLGVISVAAGLVVLAKPSHSLTTLAVVLGVFVLIDSIYELVSSLFAERGGGGVLVGAVGTVVGILLIRHPVHGVLAIGLLIGLWFVVVGVVRLVRAFALKSRGWNLAVALVELVVGIVIVSSPDAKFATLAALVGISLILNGVVTAGLGWSMHALRRAAASVTPSAGLRP